jgi:hypothetical protein
MKYTSVNHCGSNRLASIALVAVMFIGQARAADVTADPPGAYRAPAPDPSPVETLMLEYINRCRANPAADGLRCAQDKAVPSTVDLAMFKQEMAEAKSAPPLVFDLRLLKAARWHCDYQIHNGQGHVETKGQRGFTGETPSDRVALAGLPGGVAENAFVGPHDPWHCHLGYVVDWGAGGAGGMQAERGHRRNILNPDYRLAGVGAVPYEDGKKFACTHNFAGSSQRFVGGVVINDRNRNRFYDLGEGVEGIAISTGEQKTKSWYSGAFTLVVERDAAKLITELDGKRYAALLPEGDDNVKFDIYVSDIAAFNRATVLLESLQKIPAGEANNARRLGPEVDLYLGTQGTLIDDAIIDEIQKLVVPIRTRIDDDMNVVRKAVADESVEKARQAASLAARKYARTKISTWFSDAVICIDIKDGYVRMAELAKSGRVPESVLSRIVKKQLAQFRQLTTPEWQQASQQWGAKTANLGDNPIPGS